MKMDEIINTQEVKNNAVNLTGKSVATEETSGFTALEVTKNEAGTFPVDKAEYKDLVRKELQLEILMRAARNRKVYELREYAEMVTGEKIIKETDE